MAKTSVIIPCWNISDIQLKLTERCISSIRDTSKVELIIIDNGSKLGSDYLRSEADIYVHFPKNMGYVKAINIGFKIASGEYLVAGNSDYFMAEGWEEAQQEVLDNIPEAGIACLHLLNSFNPETCWEEPGTPGGWWMIERELVDKLGYLDEDFFNVFADYDYVWRMKKMTGKKVISTPKCSVEHYGEASLSKFKRRLEEYNRGQWLILNKWKDDPNFEEFAGNVMTYEEVTQWLKDNIEYGKSIDYSS